MRAIRHAALVWLATVIFYADSFAGPVPRLPPGNMAVMARSTQENPSITFINRLHQSYPECERLISWAERYIIEYNVYGYEGLNFLAQIREFENERTGNLPFIQIFVEDGGHYLFGEPIFDLNYLQRDRQKGLIGKCLYRDMRLKEPELYQEFNALLNAAVRAEARSLNLEPAVDRLREVKSSIQPFLEAVDSKSEQKNSPGREKLKEILEKDEELLWPSEVQKLRAHLHGGTAEPDQNVAAVELPKAPNFIHQSDNNRNLSNSAHDTNADLSEEKFHMSAFAVAVSKVHDPVCRSYFKWLSLYMREHKLNKLSEIELARRLEELEAEINEGSPLYVLFADEFTNSIWNMPISMVTHQGKSRFSSKVRDCANIDGVALEIKETGYDIWRLGQIVANFPYPLPQSRTFRSDPSNMRILSNLTEIVPAMNTVRAAYNAKLFEFIQQISEPGFGNDAFSELVQYQKSVTKYLLPSERRKLLEVVAKAKEVAAVNEPRLARLRQEKYVAAAQRCATGAAHPDDPAKPDDIVGIPDDELQTSPELERACLEAMETPEHKAMSAFHMGRLLIRRRDEAQAKEFLSIAADEGSAAGLAYLADMQDDPDRALPMYREAAGKGFAPAATLVPQMETYLEELAAYRKQEEEFAEAELLAVQARDAAILKCDEVAAHPDDQARLNGVSGLPDDEIDVAAALDACIAAVQAAPEEARMHFNLARALLIVDEFQSEARERFQIAADGGHGPAFAYLAFLADDQDALALLENAADAEFQPAIDALVDFGYAPRPWTLAHVLKDPEIVKEIENVDPSEAVSLRPAFDEAECRVYHIEDNLSRQAGFLMPINDIVEYVTGSKVTNPRSAAAMVSASADSLVKCEIEKMEWPDCLDFFGEEQLTDLFNDQPIALQKLIGWFVRSGIPIEERMDYADYKLGALTDLIVYRYAVAESILSENSEVYFDRNFSLSADSDPTVRQVVDELKNSHKYFIAATTMARGAVCQ